MVEKSGEEAARQRRETQRKAIERDNLSDIHVQNCRVFPTRTALVADLEPEGIGVEVGVAYGSFTKTLLKEAKPTKLHLVDSWDSERYSPGKLKVEARFEDEIRSGQVMVNQGLSVDVMPNFDDRYFDWIYLDTNHSYETTAAELKLAAQKVKPGGLILGHDYCIGNPVAPYVYGVIPAVNEFCVTAAWELTALSVETYGFWTFCIRKL